MEKKAGIPHLEMQSSPGLTTVRFEGSDLTLHEQAAQETADQLFRLAEGMTSGTLVLSFAGVTFLTSTMLGKLMALHKRLQSAGASLVLCDLRPEVLELFTIAGLHRVLNIRRDE